MSAGTLDLGPGANIDAIQTGIVAATATFNATNSEQYGLSTSSGILMNAGTIKVLSKEGLDASETGIFAATMTLSGLFQVASPVITSPGTLVVESTSSTDGNPILHLQNNSGTTVLQILNSGKVQTTGTLPTISACGTGPTRVGNSTAGKVTIGTGGAVTSCTVTFATAYPRAPACVVRSSTSDHTVGATTTTTVLTINASSAANFASKVISYLCIGI
jgi:hypothetical protein